MIVFHISVHELENMANSSSASHLLVVCILKHLVTRIIVGISFVDIDHSATSSSLSPYLWYTFDMYYLAVHSVL